VRLEAARALRRRLDDERAKELAAKEKVEIEAERVRTEIQGMQKAEQESAARHRWEKRRIAWVKKRKAELDTLYTPFEPYFDPDAYDGQMSYTAPGAAGYGGGDGAPSTAPEQARAQDVDMAANPNMKLKRSTRKALQKIRNKSKRGGRYALSHEVAILEDPETPAYAMQLSTKYQSLLNIPLMVQTRPNTVDPVEESMLILSRSRTADGVSMPVTGTTKRAQLRRLKSQLASSQSDGSLLRPNTVTGATRGAGAGVGIGPILNAQLSAADLGVPSAFGGGHISPLQASPGVGIPPRALSVSSSKPLLTLSNKLMDGLRSGVPDRIPRRTVDVMGGLGVGLTLEDIEGELATSIMSTTLPLSASAMDSIRNSSASHIPSRGSSRRRIGDRNHKVDLRKLHHRDEWAQQHGAASSRGGGSSPIQTLHARGRSGNQSEQPVTTPTNQAGGFSPNSQPQFAYVGGAGDIAQSPAYRHRAVMNASQGRGV
jgi:hypothetical protein